MIPMKKESLWLKIFVVLLITYAIYWKFGFNLNRLDYSQEYLLHFWCKSGMKSPYTGHSAYDAMSTESNRVKIDGFYIDS
jgi:hypothetical protein